MSVINTSFNDDIVVTSDCIRNKSRRVECRLCIDACSSGALSITSSGTVEIIPDACSGCGGCTAACPVMAITGPFPERQTADDQLYLDAITAPSVKELLLYYRAGYRTLVVDENHFAWRDVVERTNSLLHACHQVPFLMNYYRHDDNHASAEQLDVVIARRRFLHIGTVQRYLGKKTSPTNRLISDIFPDYQLFSININKNACSLCSSCLKLCPTGVFHYQNKQLVIESGECVGCKLCQESCPESAIEVREEIAKKTQTHYSFNVAFCPRCQNPFPSLNPGEHLCPACSMQEKLRFTGDRIGMKSLNFSA
ncbi:4Fe-4S dicluster domain-containing protein [Escherichia coli O5:H32]|uniref:4Fe-4S dicluster domain-containing protein n=2 Tax=Enterobacterales TaxID=91347 RepID=UPI0004D7EC99|nr:MULTISPECIES: 4Fe-4S dicluster domain-containing protein [Enterobacteriaceae]EAR4674253.1 4Fe-4S dicluster domain-containing protein [Salmonella enterica]EAT3277181.1 4Fe-4S dicluster domain-containing protein [Salmonella enterica subsp. enterica serovar Senftenberg]EGT0628176.1 4Fe-4S dicluster domain-containing protein [Citrobacter freundii]EIU7402191.1 4Fe-4S dicluster domain-containing protein [Salmonella enterica subsp. enterica serovar Rissen]EJF0242058.1 4Fe-4S dicluster domain-conta